VEHVKRRAKRPGELTSVRQGDLGRFAEVRRHQNILHDDHRDLRHSQKADSLPPRRTPLNDRIDDALVAARVLPRVVLKIAQG
jgi:hypothetical protein